jgi:hypothetical protein
MGSTLTQLRWELLGQGRRGQYMERLETLIFRTDY